MRIAYLDCFAGISGDMFLGALTGAGVPLEVLQNAASAMNLNVTLKQETVDRSGISSIKIHVLENGTPAEGPPPDTFAHQQAPIPHTHAPKTQHLHKTGQPHTHDHSHEEPHGHEETHPHVHGRSLTTIRTMIQAAPLTPAVKSLAIHTFELLGQSEAKIHNVPVNDIHFHEVGAVDAIIDIVAASAGIVHLDIGAWHSSPVNVGGGMVVCAHGTFPVPAPATADLLRNIPTYSAHIQKELATPTGAAILRALSPTFGPQPPMSVSSIGYGAGTRNPESFPNVLRLSLGESSESTETIQIIETNIDDATPQLLAHVAELAFTQGALDVTLTPVIMKKGRPGTIVTLLCAPVNQPNLTQLLLRELPTLGVRTRTETRTILDRAHRTAETPYGPIRIKSGSLNGTLLNETPEYEDCRAAAALHNLPLKTIQQAALTSGQSSTSPK